MRTKPTDQGTTPRSLSPLFLVIFFTYLSLVLVSVQGCGTGPPQEHKWLFYDLEAENGLVYQGYKTNLHAEDDGTLKEEDIEIFPDNPKSLYKPTLDEDDQLHLVIRGAFAKPSACIFVETDYTPPHDSKVAPEYQIGKTKIAAQVVDARSNKVATSTEQWLGHKIVTRALDERASELRRQATEVRKNSGPLSNAFTMADNEAITASRRAEKAKIDQDTAERWLKSDQEQLNESKQELAVLKLNKEMIVCDLDVREKGSKRIDFMLVEGEKTKLEEIQPKNINMKDTILVHELYRYRILAGPVFSTLQKHNKTYELRPNNAGQSVITAIPAQDHPANFALLLKIYHTKRDTLNPPSLFSDRWHETFNPIIGINLLDKPLQNFYAGFSFEPWGGFDIIGGVHWAKTQQLVDGFSQGQVTTQASGLTKERFNNGWFVGVAADIGVITTWLKSAGNGIVTAIKATP